MPPRRKQELPERAGPELLARVEDFRGQALARKVIEAYLQRGRMAGTILLLGERGLGKTTLASLIARSLVCERNREQHAGQRFWFCGECYACSSIASGNQPEYVTVRPRGQDITVTQVREEFDGFSSALLHPSVLSHRIFIFDDAHHLNEETGNQLLKLLEEAPERTVFIMVSDRPGMLLPTIHSRGQKIRLSPMSAAELRAALLQDEPQAGGDAVAEAVRMSAGRYVDARWLLLNRDWREAVKRLAAVLGGGRGELAASARPLADMELARLWDKELSDSGLSEEDAAKLIPAARRNTLARLALGLAYDRAAWWALTQQPLRRGILDALAEMKTRVSQNCDPELAQAALSVRLGI
ncbi:AAA family ATPase [bacterium]|nr:AAA family ATPase [bacterium]